MSRFIVGLTGGIGSGKTTVANQFAAQGASLIDADLVAREVVEPGSQGLKAIIGHFGDALLTADGQLNRAALRELVFSSAEHKAWLDSLLHPLIRQEMLRQTQQAEGDYVIWVVPLLFENQLDQLVDRTLVVDLPESVQLARTLKRDASSELIIKNIIASQIDRGSRLEKADDVIDNSGKPDMLSDAILKLHQTYLTLATSK